MFRALGVATAAVRGDRVRGRESRDRARGRDARRFENSPEGESPGRADPLFKIRRASGVARVTAPDRFAARARRKAERRRTQIGAGARTVPRQTIRQFTRIAANVRLLLLLVSSARLAD